MSKCETLPELANEIHKLEIALAEKDAALKEKDNEIELLKTALGLVGMNSDEYR